MNARNASLVVLVATLIGCGSTADGGGDPGEGPGAGSEAYGCLPVTITEVELDETTPLGFTGQDVLALAAGEHAASLEWAKGGKTELALVVAHAGTKARFVDREWQDDGSGMEPAMDCGDVIELDATVAFGTSDGAFAESWNAIVSAGAPDAASIWQDVAPSEIAGGYQVTEVDPSQYDELTLFFSVALDGTGAHGEVSGQAVQGGDDPSPDGVVSAESFQVAAF
jgi:hypothetical protein